MSLPNHLLVETNATRLFSKAGAIVDQYAESQTATAFDPEVWERGLSALDFNLSMLTHFLGTWEGSGSFVNEACDWWDEQARVKRALAAFGCEKTAAIFDEAAELGMQIANRYDSGRDITPEQERQREEMNRITNDDVSYEKLAAFIRQHKDEFLR